MQFFLIVARFNRRILAINCANLSGLEHDLIGG
jgi:hypothetical protein